MRFTYKGRKVEITMDQYSALFSINGGIPFFNGYTEARDFAKATIDAEQHIDAQEAK
jgi:hypothetical protein